MRDLACENNVKPIFTRLQANPVDLLAIDSIAYNASHTLPLKLLSNIFIASAPTFTLQPNFSRASRKLRR